MVELNTPYLQKIIPEYKSWLDSEEGKDQSEEQDEKIFFIESYFAAKEIDNLDEGVLRDLIQDLYTFSGWTNKDWLLAQMLQSGLPEIRKAFKNLLYSDEHLAKRFDQMRQVKMMGAATISEVLTLFDPKNYAIYNRRAKLSLIRIGVDENSLPKNSQINGSQYVTYLEIVKSAFKKVKQIYPELSDLLEFDFLLYYISELVEEKVEKELTVVPEEGFDHDATIDLILQLGDGLGFDIQKEYKVTSGCRIDAIWKSRVANLGTITYAFEIHNRGSRDSAILNLQRIFNADATVQKVIIVAINDELTKFKEEIKTLSEDFRNSVGYFPVKSLNEALLHQEALKKILESIGLMKTRTTKNEP